MLATKDDFHGILIRFEPMGFYALDTETTGLHPWLGNRLFSIILADQEESVYFNFNDNPDIDPKYVLPREWLADFQGILSGLNKTWFMHNAKFDLSMLAVDGLEVRGKVHCTEAVGRVLRNDRSNYKLATLAAEIGYQKDDAVEKHISKNGLFTWIRQSGKKKRTKNLHYDQVPFDIIAPYGVQDGVITRALGMHQIEELEKLDKSVSDNLPSPGGVASNEIRLTKTLFDMECCGVRFDREYSEGAIVYLDGIIKKAEKDFEKIAGRELVDSQIVLGETFQKLGVDVPGFKKASYDDDALSKIDHPLAGIMQTWRKASKKANTYFRNFLALGDYNNIIHTGFRQGGTRTGRLSCAQPNLQNLTKDREGRDWPIRRAFIPRDNKYFVMIDYDQMEYRFMMDMAAEMDIIKAVLGGLDVHTATAEKTGITRDKAKTLNFLLIYGGGINAICNKLGIEAAAATLLRNKYFAGLPRTRKLTTDIQSIARSRGYVFNWKGRRYYFSDPTKAYKAPNYIVQGGCSDIIKLAMNNIAAFLKDVPNVKMLLQVHDEIIFEMTPEEFKHIPMLKSLMENAWKPRYLPLTCSVSHSFKSWQDKVEGEPKWN